MSLAIIYFKGCNFFAVFKLCQLFLSNSGADISLETKTIEPYKLIDKAFIIVTQVF